MELDLSKALLLSFLSILALSFPCRAATWPHGRNLSVAADASPPCGVGEAGCSIADLQPELEEIADPGMLGASLATSSVSESALVRGNAGCGRHPPNGRYTTCTPEANKQRIRSPDCRVPPAC